MSPHQPDLENIFAAALAMESVEDRTAYVEEACLGDARLRQKIDRLLAAHFATEDFLEKPAAELMPPAAVEASEQPGSRVDHYRILEEIGEGGFGIVYLAEQEAPVERKVALKVIKPGMDSRQIIGRFETERQALALMDHPHVSRVLDGGTTESGRPYFVMDLIQGPPVTEYCDQAKLTTRQRLELFRDVCLGIEHAHQKGVIHRDVKPSNVLVTTQDSHPVAKVIDFGVAKAIRGSLTGNTSHTRSEQLIGTPLYMSPEQTAGAGSDIDTRTDVYSLGVLLYELLTGVPPLDSNRIQETPHEEIRRIIREEPLPTPSQRLSTTGLDTLSAIATRRRIDPTRLAKLLRGDLDWIVMKALEKDRDRRYGTAGALAADVERYLTDEPVTARPPSAWYRFEKFARRNRLALGLTASVLLAVTAVIGSAGWLIGERAARHGEAERLAGQAISEANAALLGRDWSTARLALTRATGLLVRKGGRPELSVEVEELTKDLDLVERLEQLQRELAELHDDVDQFARVATSRYEEAFGRSHLPIKTMSVGAATAAVRSRTTALRLTEAIDRWALHSRAEEEDDWQHLLAIASEVDPDPVRSRIRTLWTTKDLKALVDFAETVSVEDMTPFSVWLLAQLLSSTRQLERSLALLKEAQQLHPGEYWITNELAHQLHVVDRWDDSLRFATNLVALRPQSYAAHIELGHALVGSGHHEEAVSHYEAAARRFPNDARLLEGLGQALMKAGEMDSGIAAFRKATRLDPLRLSRLANTLRKHGRLDEALDAFREAIRRNPQSGYAHSNFGKALEEQGRREESLEAYREAVRVEPERSAWHSNLGNGLAQIGAMEEAIEAYREAVRLDSTLAPVYSNLGKALHTLGKLDEAVDSLQKCIRLDPDFVLAHYNLGHVRMAQSRFDDAISAYNECVRLSPDEAWTHDAMASALSAGGRSDEAIASLREAVRLRPAWACYHHHLGRLLLRTGEHEAATEPLERSTRLQPTHDSHFLDLASALLTQQRYEEARGAFEQALRIQPRHPRNRNALAWFLVTCPVDELRNTERAVELARGATVDAPQNGGVWNTLGVAYYRHGDWTEAVKALERSMQLSNGGTAFDFFFLAMTHHRLGHLEEAGSYHRRALGWMAENQPDDRELIRFRAEAASLLVNIPLDSDPQSSAE